MLDITSGLAAYYDFEDGSGTSAADSAGFDDTGTLVNSPTWSTDSAVGGTALDFSGDAVSNNATVQVADSANLDLSGDFSIAFWYNSDTTSAGTVRLVGSHDGSSGFSIFGDNAGNLTFYLSGSTVQV